MGLMTQLQGDAERLVRQEKNAQRAYSHDSRGIKAEAAPHEAVVKDYNAQVEGFKNSAFMRQDNGSLWQVLGWVSHNAGYPAVVAQPTNIDSTPKYKAEGNEVMAGSGSGLLYSTYASPEGGGFYWTSKSGKTIRNSEGVPIDQLNPESTWANASPYYASLDDRPFVAPVSKAQTDTATAADTALKSLADKAQTRTEQYDKAAGLIGSRADRLALDADMLQNRAREEPQAGLGASVFAQNTNVFQSIADWLK